MKFICGKCFKTVVDPAEAETPEGYFYNCDDCGTPIAFSTYDEVDEVVRVVFSHDEARYLTHLVNKQLDKLKRAEQQLINIKRKMVIHD
jgi:hypothetical protein